MACYTKIILQTFNIPNNTDILTEAYEDTLARTTSCTDSINIQLSRKITYPRETNTDLNVGLLQNAVFSYMSLLRLYSKPDARAVQMAR